ncbi:MAG: Fe-S cluster assembly protein SufD [Candidatus Protochlamydia sp.]|nr:Fe-S cluster assembly protein SufD [Candidatus Protochlamydia sp.]
MIVDLEVEKQLFTALLEKHLSVSNQKDALQKSRQKAWDHFLTLGLPSKQTEVYRYIKLRQLFSQNYEMLVETEVSLEQVEPFILDECAHSCLVFVNGRYMPQLSKTEGIPSQVVVSTLEEAALTFGTLLNNHWTKSIKEEKDPFAIINSALHREGAFLYIPPKTVVEAPIQLLHLVHTKNQLSMVMPRLNVFAGARSDVKLVSSQSQLAHNGYFVNQVVDFVLEEESHVHYTQILNGEHPDSWHFEAVRAFLKGKSTFKTVSVTEGSMTVRTDYHVILAGENAEALLNGVWMLADKREAHIHIFIDHQAPQCRSYQLFKGVLNDFSRSSFEGKIMVRQAAQKTEAFQLNNNLLLNDHAHADSKPNLEIFADDVKASHGATVGQLDIEQLFYMKTRGFPEEEAKNLLIYGFAEQVIQMIPLESLRNSISERVARYIRKKN